MFFAIAKAGLIKIASCIIVNVPILDKIFGYIMPIFEDSFVGAFNDLVGGVKMMGSAIWGTYENCNMQTNLY